jgi:hypothetical protein
MSAPAPSGNVGGSVLKIVVLIMGIAGIVALPVAGFILGQWIGQHMALSDFSQAYSIGGLLNIFATNINHTSSQAANTYSQMANALEGYGITLANADINVLAMFGLALGLILDAPLALLIYKEYKEL